MPVTMQSIQYARPKPDFALCCDTVQKSGNPCPGEESGWKGTVAAGKNRKRLLVEGSVFCRCKAGGT